MNAKFAFSISVLFLASILLIGCSQPGSQTLVTIADARVHKAEFIDVGTSGDSLGDMFVFDQPLLDVQSRVVVNLLYK